MGKHSANTGIDGEKDPNDAISMFADSRTQAQLDASLSALEAAAQKPGTLDKTAMVRASLAKKKKHPGLWTDEVQRRFKAAALKC